MQDREYRVAQWQKSIFGKTLERAVVLARTEIERSETSNHIGDKLVNKFLDYCQVFVRTFSHWLYMMGAMLLVMFGTIIDTATPATIQPSLDMPQWSGNLLVAFGLASVVAGVGVLVRMICNWIKRK